MRVNDTVAVRAVIVCPFPLEYSICRKTLLLESSGECLGYRYSSRIAGDTAITALLAGPGMENCAAATRVACESLSATCIIDAGSAGSLVDWLNIGDVVCVRRAFQYDERASTVSESRRSAVFAIRTTMDSNDPGNAAWMNDLSSWMMRRFNTRMTVGDMASGEYSVEDDGLRVVIRDTIGAVAFDWETWSVLKTASSFTTAALSFRVITDHAGDSMRAEFRANIRGALSILYSTLGEFFIRGILKGIVGDFAIRR